MVRNRLRRAITPGLRAKSFLARIRDEPSAKRFKERGALGSRPPAKFTDFVGRTPSQAPLNLMKLGDGSGDYPGPAEGSKERDEKYTRV
jgi:hypothetical protein